MKTETQNLFRVAIVGGATLKGKELKPGMPAEVFLQTGSRMAFSYFVKPLTDQFAHAFKEE